MQITIMISTVTNKSAAGVSGCLIQGHDQIFFRVYDDQGKFIDYAIFLSDLFVTIKDTDALFYHKDFGVYSDILDHSPSTLGIKT